MATGIITQLPKSRSIHCAIDNIAERSYTIDSIAEHSYTIDYREKHIQIVKAYLRHAQLATGFKFVHSAVAISCI
jgi:hypothetical protein